MTIDNPWQSFPHEIYDKHMGHKNVRQIETLSKIFSDQLSFITTPKESTIAVLGITSGNGLENIKAGQYKAIVGMDINKGYLDICRERHGGLMPELELYQIDLMTEKERVKGILQQADLITANLLVKHIHLTNFMDIVSELEKPIVSVTIQYNPDGQSLSHSGYEAAFEDITKHGENHDEEQLDTAMRDAGYILIGKEEYGLPNKKAFIRLDYRR